MLMLKRLGPPRRRVPSGPGAAAVCRRKHEWPNGLVRARVRLLRLRQTCYSSLQIVIK